VSLNPVAQDDFDRALSLFQHGRAQEAHQAFSAFIINHPDDPLRSAAELHLGRLEVQRGDFSAAAVWFGQAMQANHEAVAANARRELGQALIRLGEPRRAIDVLEPLAGRLDGADAAELYLLLSQAAAAAEDTERHIRYLDARCRFGGRSVCRETEAMLHRIVSQLEESHLDRLFVTLPRHGQGWVAVASRLGMLAVGQGQRERAVSVLSQLEQAGVDGDALDALRDALEQMEQVDWTAVGVLLPLSGRARFVGEQMRQGLQLATGDEGALRLVVRDSAHASADMSQLVESLVRDERVAAIVGPVDARQAEVAAAQADAMGVPLLALSIRPQLPQESEWVLRPFQSNEAEVRLLLNHALQEGQSKRFAILHPSHGYGQVMRELVESEVARRGSTVVAVQSYDPAQTAFAEQCQALAQHDFDVLFLADRSRTVALLVPALASAGMWSGPTDQRLPADGRMVQFLLPSAAFDPSLARQAGRYLQGAVFASVLWVDDPAPEVVRFVEGYRDLHGGTPSAYAVQAHDAVQVLRAAQQHADGRSRAALLQSLAASDQVSTAGRFEGFDDQGEPVAPLHLYALEGDTFRRVDDGR
jgi:ABC-type branched-subunit amino acid transport system substrate-binding protein